MQAPRILQSSALKQIARRYHDFVPATTLNDLPVPQGNWKTVYEANQRRYNAHLALGVAFLTGSILFGKVAGLFEFNWEIPDRPADIQSYKE